MNAYAFFGNIKVILVSILIQVATSAVTVLGEYIIKIFFHKCSGFLTPSLSLLKIIPIFCSLDEVFTL